MRLARNAPSMPGRAGGWPLAEGARRGTPQLALAAALALALGLLLYPPLVRAGSAGRAVELVTALNGVEALPDSAMAKEAAGRSGADPAAGAHVLVVVPRVRLWDDLGAPSAATVGTTTVTVSGMGHSP